MTTLRPVTAAELPDYLGRMSQAFRSQRPSRQEVEGRAAMSEATGRRNLGVFDDGSLVATAATHPLTLTVPGGRLSAAGIGGVTVLPTHRRRGHMTALLRRQVEDARERGEPVAILYASEGGIYGRFGFGVATYECEVRVARHRGAFVRPAGVDGLRLVPFSEALDGMLAIVDRVCASRPGALRRPDAWWRHIAAMPPPGPAPVEVVVRAEGDGFAVYERRIDLALPALEGGSLHLHWLFADTPAAYAALWRYCLDVDLMDEVRAPNRPADEPLRHLLANPRALEATVWDGLWLRLVDAGAALAARTYAGGAPVRIRIEDDFCPWNTGTFEVGEEGCRRVSGAPDLALAADALGACYLGGTRFVALALAGRVEERSPGAARRADALFAAGTVPWCPFHF